MDPLQNQRSPDHQNRCWICLRASSAWCWTWWNCDSWFSSFVFWTLPWLLPVVLHHVLVRGARGLALLFGWPQLAHAGVVWTSFPACWVLGSALTRSLQRQDCDSKWTALDLIVTPSDGYTDCPVCNFSQLSTYSRKLMWKTGIWWNTGRLATWFRGSPTFRVQARNRNHNIEHMNLRCIITLDPSEGRA